MSTEKNKGRKRRKNPRKLLKLHRWKAYLLDINYQLCLQLMFFFKSEGIIKEWLVIMRNYFFKNGC